MAKKSYSNQPLDPEKIDIQSPPDESIEKSGQGKKYLRVSIHGSLTLWSHRYEGIQEWAEDDPKISAGRGNYDVIGEVYK